MSETKNFYQHLPVTINGHVDEAVNPAQPIISDLVSMLLLLYLSFNCEDSNKYFPSFQNQIHSAHVKAICAQHTE